MSKKSKSNKGGDKVRPLYLLEDEPVRDLEVDRLGLLPFARVVAGAALGTPGPFTVGVFADWGEGKTSVLRLAKALLDGERKDHPEVVTVWFNAWQYELEEHPIVPLIASIVSAVERREKDDTSGLADATRTGLARISRALRAAAYGFSARAKVKVPGFGEIESGFVAKEMIERYERLEATGDPLLERSLYYNAFALLEEVVRPRMDAGGGSDGGESPLPKIVVFIDDLDRCLPPQALRLLESMKLALAQPGFVFALGVDRRVLEGFLRKRYQEDYGLDQYAESGKSYLDKMIQLPMALPAHRSRFEEYIRRQLRQAPAFQDGRNKTVRVAVEDLIPVLAAGSAYNPRNLVRFINNLIVDVLLWAEAGEKQQEGTSDLLALAIVSRMLRQHLGEDLYGHLVYNRGLCDSLARYFEAKTSSGESEDQTFEELREEVSRAEKGKVLLRIIEVKVFLEELFAKDAGRKWLEEHKTREGVHEFLVKEREAEGDHGDDYSSPGREVVERELRRRLGKPAESAVTPQDLASVTALNLSHAPVTDQDLVRLAACTSLRSLWLSGTGVSDDGLSFLAGLEDLRVLSLRGTNVTDGVVPTLSKLSSLQRLYLEDTPFTPSGVDQLRDELPDCEIKA